MSKILKLIINDYQNQKLSNKYQLILTKVCEAEKICCSTLNKEKQAEYLNFESIINKLILLELYALQRIY